MIRDALDEIVA